MVLNDLREVPALHFDQLQISDPRLYFEGAHAATTPGKAAGGGSEGGGGGSSQQQQQQKAGGGGGQRQQQQPGASAAADRLSRLDPFLLADPPGDPAAAQSVSLFGRSHPSRSLFHEALCTQATHNQPPSNPQQLVNLPQRHQVLLELSGGAGALGGLEADGRPTRHPHAAIPGWEDELRKHAMVVNELLRHFWGCIPCNSEPKRKKMDKVMVGWCCCFMEVGGRADFGGCVGCFLRKTSPPANVQYARRSKWT
jgi:hypothetical protein